MPGRRTFRAGVKWFFWPALIILSLNIETLASSFGWRDGVANRNRLIAPISNCDDVAERAALEQWGTSAR